MNIYSISDLMTKPFDDEEIEKVNNGLIYSLIIGMFNIANINISEKDIIALVKKDNWYDEYYWTKKQRNEYKKNLDNIFYNLYRFGPIKCSNTSNDFLLRYGLKIKTKKNTKK